ncbi:hypothetical protein VMCG_00599 [Cytospora schulzeri]|uniref:Uncharacterized protein n=1 Tax=Cytospora schulzeri TaxID=448051 RepID=A0A423X851_9PEZI|nr:hypothetical protein VMCG_00599 [Valsa malicola]
MTSRMGSANRSNDSVVVAKPKETNRPNVQNALVVPPSFGGSITVVPIAMIQTNGIQPWNGQGNAINQMLLSIQGLLNGQQPLNGGATAGKPQITHREHRAHREHIASNVAGTTRNTDNTHITGITGTTGTTHIASSASSAGIAANAANEHNPANTGITYRAQTTGSAGSPTLQRTHGTAYPSQTPEGKLLTGPMIDKAFKLLNQELGRQRGIELPVKMVVLGGALAVKKFKSRTSTVAIDMILDPRLGEKRDQHQIFHQCIRKVAQGLGQDWMKDHYKHYFTCEAREKVFNQSVEKVEKGAKGERQMLYCGKRLHVYAMDAEVALEMELRRMAAGGRQQNWDLSDATTFLHKVTNGGLRPISFTRCKNLDAGGKHAPVPDDAVRMVQEEFRKRYSKLGIVENEFDEIEKLWKYRNMEGQWVLYPQDS